MTDAASTMKTVRTSAPGSSSEDHQRVTDAIMADVHDGPNRAVIVDSPPGAGKSTFVVRAAAELAAVDRVPLVAQTNAQADDLVAKLRDKHPDLTVGRLHGGSSYAGPHSASGKLLISKSIGDMEEANVIVATAAKWAYVEDLSFPVGIIDEAYQMRSDQLLYVADLFPRALMVGDPGQLDPFTPVDDTRWRSQPDGPVQPAVATVRHNHPEIEPHRLPVSWRLSARCAPLVADSFYPHLPFRAGTNLAERALSTTGPGPNESPEVSTAINKAVADGWGLVNLPGKVCPNLDAEAIDVVARCALGVLERKLEADDSPGEDGLVDARRIAVGVVHRRQRSAVRIRLDELGKVTGVDTSAVVVDTANRLQGREFHVVIVLHPLSARAAASEFHLETGRLCVLLSRHRHACIVVARDGIGDVLDAHPMSRPIWIGAPLPIPDGWEANHAVIDQLNRYRVG